MRGEKTSNSERCNPGRFSDEPLFEYVYGGSPQAQSIVFIDELDAVGKERGLIKGSGGKEHDATLNQVNLTRYMLLQESCHQDEYQINIIQSNDTYVLELQISVAIKDFYQMDGRTIVSVADPTFGNILDFNVGETVDLDIPRSFWSCLAENMEICVDATKAKLLEICRFDRNVGDGNMGTGMLPVPYDVGGIC
ncbi:hypothetical protein Tco_0927057 [Tanacetum coccineum]|uniref:ATPase AAA-type core domain-containing protein n=1 Tax=Tanacetum coccineum TaxID=301880 RepID=A0ABQ5DCG1_9ASTR